MAGLPPGMDTTFLVKFIQNMLERNPPSKLEQVAIDNLTARKIVVTDEAQFTKAPNFRVIGQTGQPAFANSWVKYGAPYFNPAFWRDPLGFVHLRGVMKDGTVGSAAFTLPPGFRPEATVIVPVLSNNAIGRLDIGADGTVTPVSPSSNLWVSLDGVHFKL